MDFSRIKIGIFCSSKDSALPVFEQSVVMLMQILNEIGIRNIVYGGGKKGLMGIVYREAVMYRMNLIGHNLDRWSSPECENEILYHTLVERQAGLIASCHMFIALPGGIGTVYEIIQVLCHNDVDHIQKPVLLYNVNSFFTNLVVTLQDIHRNGLIDSNLGLAVINSNEELVRQVVGYTNELAQHHE